MRGKEGVMILKICIELEMPNNIHEQLKQIGASLDIVEDTFCEGITDSVCEMLPMDTKLKECYPMGWDI